MKNQNLEGYLYIVYNESFEFYGNNVYKIGKTKDIHQRMNAYITCFIKPCEITFLSEKCKNYTLAEGVVFRRLNMSRIVKNREFFQLDKHLAINTIIEVIEGVNNDTITHLGPKPKKEPDIHTNMIILFTYTEFLKQCKISEKVKLLRQIEEAYDIAPLDVSLKKTGNIEMSNDLIKNINSIFRTKKTKPTNYYELNKLYVMCIRNISTKEIVLTTRINERKEGDRGKYKYQLNEPYIIEHINKLNSEELQKTQNWLIESYRDYPFH